MSSIQQANGASRQLGKNAEVLEEMLAVQTDVDTALDK